MYCLTIGGVETHMMVTRNMFSYQLTLHCKYDLMGSTVAREASGKKAKNLPTYKDNDFLSEGQKCRKERKVKRTS